MDRDNGSKNAKYPQCVREFALKLNYYSPRAYNFLREEVCRNLPSVKQLLVWTSHVEVKPGIIRASINFIKKQNQEAEIPIVYSISFDEMNIRQQIIFDGIELKGFVDYGDLAVTNKTDQAKNALVLLANQINGSYKIVIGYLLTNGLHADLLASVILKSLSEMYHANARVLTISFDGLPANFSSVTQLGANLDVWSPDFKPFIFCPQSQQRIYLFPDPCHMFKLMRNTLESLKVLIDPNGEEIKWEFFENLVEVQTNEGLKLGNKLTSRHVRVAKQKMKVKLAVQLLSSSTSVAISVCEDLGVTGFENSSATCKFVKIMDRLFDILNSRPLGSSFKAPISKWNVQMITSFNKSALSYLFNLTLRSGKFLMHRKNKTGVIGLITCIKTIDYLIEEMNLKTLELRYIPTYKLSQDPLELFFSSLRQRFGSNNNPNALQFQQALRRMLAVNICPNSKGNCISQDIITTPRISPFQNAVNDKQDSLPIRDSDFEDEYHELSLLSALVSNIVVYIAGFVGQSVMKILDCKSCGFSLVGEYDYSEFHDHLLLSRKNNGGLFIPSKDLIKTCEITERAIRTTHGVSLAKIDIHKIIQLSMRKCLEEQVFLHLRLLNTVEHPQFGSHVLDLVSIVVKKYTKLRFFHIARESTFGFSPESCRNQLTKLITFRGQ